MALPLAKRPDSAGADERQLVTRAQAGDSEAFNELADRYSTRLRRVLYRITRDCDAAYDAVQEALFHAWQNIGRFEGRSRFYTWLTRIGINEAYRVMRKAPVELLDIDDSVGQRVPDWGSLPDDVFESREFLRAIDRTQSADSVLGSRGPSSRSLASLHDVSAIERAQLRVRRCRLNPFRPGGSTPWRTTAPAGANPFPLQPDHTGEKPAKEWNDEV